MEGDSSRERERQGAGMGNQQEASGPDILSPRLCHFVVLKVLNCRGAGAQQGRTGLSNSGFAEELGERREQVPRERETGT